MQSDCEIVKIALKIDDESVLYKINKSDSLEKIINDICKEYKKNNINNKHGLQFIHAPDNKTNLKNKYVTDENLVEIKDGYMISLVCSIQYMLEWIFVSTTEYEDLMQKLIHLPNLCDDIGAINEMTKRSYQNKIPSMAMKLKEDYLFLCLKALNNILNHGIRPTSINEKFIEFLVTIIKEDKNSMKILTISLQLINKIMNNNYDCNYIINTLEINDVTPYFWRDENSDLQLQTITLLNNIIEKLDKDKDKFIVEISLPKHKNIIYKYLTSNAAKCPKLSHELCVLQSFILSPYQGLLNEQLNYNNEYSDVIELKSLNYENNRRETLIDFEEKEVRSRLNTYSSDSSGDILSFSRSISTYDQIDGISLRSKDISMYTALEPIIITKLSSICVDYYKNKYEKNFTMSVLETQYYPGFYKVCDQITHLLCDLLYINKTPDQHSKLYVPLIFYSKEEFFEELFCRAVWLLARTRREMRAKVDEDHGKVLAVLKEQILIALDSRPMKFKELTDKLKKISYQNVFDKWEKERNNKWVKLLQHKPDLQEVKNKLEPNIKDLIREQRMEILKRGEAFPKLPEKRGKQHYWFIQLTKNNKSFLYGDYDIDTNKFTSNKTEVSVNKIQHIIVGKACKLVKENKVRRSELIHRCFSILLDNETSLDFLAATELIAQYWIDGLHLLIGKAAESKSYKSELDMLLTMELNIHLLELQNISIPDNPPEIPPLPFENRQKPNIPPKSDHLRQSIINRRTISNL